MYVYSTSENSAELQKGDVIIAIDDVEIKTMDELNEQKNQHKAGETVKPRISRNGQSMEVQVTLQERKPET